MRILKILRRSVLFLALSWVIALTPHPPILSIADETASAVAWHPDGTILAVGNSAGIRLYTETLQLIRQFPQPTEQMKAILWSPDGQYLAAYGLDDVGDREPSDTWNPTVYIWDVKNASIKTIFRNHALTISEIDWSPDGTKIVSGSWDKTIQIWDPLTSQVLQTLVSEYDDYSPVVMSVAWSPDNNQVAYISPGLFLWNPLTGEKREVVKMAGRNPPYPVLVKWSPDGNFLATGSGIFDLQTQTEITFNNCPQSGSLAWHPDARSLALFTRDELVVCDAPNDKIIAVLEGRIGDAEVLIGYDHSLSWHPDGKRLAGAAGDGFIRIWQVFE